jgi:hypothetical protein
MAAPTSYTEAELKAYIHASLAGVAEVFGWTVAGGSYDEMVNDALLALGHSDIASVSGVQDVSRLRTVARLMAWRAVVEQSSMNFDFSADGGSYSRSQVNEMARERVSALETETAGYLGTFAAHTQPVKYAHDPYTERTVEELAL